MKSRSSQCILLMFAFLSLSGCEETLPPYEQPVLSFATEIIPSFPSTVTYDEQGDLFDVNYVPRRIYGTATPIEISFVNLYEETLQGVLSLTGKVEIWTDALPLYRTTIPITRYDVGQTIMIDPVKNILTMNPGQKLWLKTSWTYKLDNGNWINTILPIKDENVLSATRTIRTHELMPYKMRASVQLFQNSAPVVTPDYEFILSVVGTVKYKP